MSDVIRLVCPACDRSRSKRISELNECIANWVYDKDFRELLACFDISVPRNGSLQEHIEKLWEAIQIWDFRKGQERWHIRTDDSRIYENRSLSYSQRAASMSRFSS